MYVNGDELLERHLAKNPDEVKYYEAFHKYKNDARITRVGKFLRTISLDKFPQLINLLKGDINLVDFRAYIISESEKLEFNNQIMLKVTLGITGLCKVSGRNELTFEERIKLDKWYIQNWSLWLDFVIFLKTIKVVLLKVGAK